MARFIVDMDINEDKIKDFMEKVVNNHTDNCMRIVCIDETMSNQYYVDEQDNQLTAEQLTNYQSFLDKNS